MNCHICQNKLSGNPIENYNTNFQLNCTSPFCPMRKFVERCRLSYNPQISKMFFFNATLWVPEEKYWYKIQIYFDLQVFVERTLVELRPGKSPLDNGTVNYLKSEHVMTISVNDDLVTKVPKMLNRIKNLVVFS